VIPVLALPGYLFASARRSVSLTSGGTVMHLCGDTTLTSRAPPPHPLQRLGKRLAEEVLRLLLCKLANGEVGLLLAGARPTESYTPDLHDCSTGAGALCLASHLACDQHRSLGQENHLPVK
jgi:hypothetical protein